MFYLRANIFNMNKLSILAITTLALCGCVANNQTVESFSVADVRLLESPFLSAQQTDIQYLLSLDADRLLAPYMREAGLKPLKPSYGNWENTGLDGHIGGHYLSALSYMYAATDNQQIGERLDYFIKMLDSCQRANGNGYLGGVPNSNEVWSEIKSGKIDAGSFSLNNRWVPLYNIHKIFAGLRDAAMVANNQKAQQMLISLTDWWIATTDSLSDDQIQQMLISEHGGLNEVFADVYAITGEQKYLQLARRFTHLAIVNPLIKGENKLTGMHANTQIPKIIGCKRIADLAHDTAWDNAANNFWNLITTRWSISIGGNSVGEHLHPYTNFSSMIGSEQGPETCNSYNMLRLSKMLFLSDPKSNYIDYYERTLYNHILSSQRPEGGFVYFTPMRPQHYRVYSQPDECFWCCVGSGLENHARYGEMIYTHNDKTLYINMFIASKLNWNEQNIEIEQNTKFPYQDFSTITIKTDKPKKFEIAIRKPIWIDDNKLTININNKKEEIASINGFVHISRTWSNGDQIHINLPMHTTVEYLPDSSNWASILYGPIVLAANNGTDDLDGLTANGSRMGHVANGPFRPIASCPTIISESRNFINQIKIDDINNLKFSIPMAVEDRIENIELQPFNTLHNCRYTVYWPVLNNDEYLHQQDSIKKVEDKLLAIKKITVDYIQLGEQQPETEHNFQSANSWVGYDYERHYRTANQWFSYQLNNQNKAAHRLLVTLASTDLNYKFNIVVNGKILATVEPKSTDAKGLYDVEYQLPTDIGKTINLRFEAIENSHIARIFGVRLTK